MRMIPDLDRDDCAGVETLQVTVRCLVAPAQFFDFPEAQERTPLRVKDGRLIPAPGQRRGPGRQQRILDFHDLRHFRFAVTLTALFPP
jgi:hypothetical protein